MGRRWPIIQFRFNSDRGAEPRTLKRVERTSISFTSEDLVALARLIQAGQVLVREEQRPPVIARIKAAMTRLGIPTPHGL